MRDCTSVSPTATRTPPHELRAFVSRIGYLRTISAQSATRASGDSRIRVPSSLQQVPIPGCDPAFPMVRGWSATRKLTDHRCTISSQAPNVPSFFMAKYVPVTVSQKHAKVSRARRVPAVLNRHDFPGSVTQVQPHGTFVRLVPGIASYADNLFTH